MPSTRTSAGSRASAAFGWRAFQRSRPSSASAFDAAREISMTGTLVLRRPVGVGREPSHSVGSPAFGSPAATAAARSAATSGGGPPASPRPGLVLGIGPALARRLDPRRLAGLLRVVRRPRARRPRPPPRASRDSSSSASSEPTASSMPAPGSPIVGEPRRHGRDRERLGLDRSAPRPRSAASRPAHRAAAGPSTPTRPCGPWRSGCSRGTRRGAPPSTTSRSRHAGTRRSTSRASASAARRTSGYVQSRSMRTLMWIPREPEVFGQPTRPDGLQRLACTPSRRRGSAATRRPGPGRGRPAARRDGRGRRRARDAG